MITPTEGVNPDAIFQCDNDKKGIVTEIKSSLPENGAFLINEIKEPIEKYSQISEGWKTPNKKIDEHSILLLVNILDSKRTQDVLEESLRNGQISTKRNICLAEWSPPISSNKVGKGDIMLLRHRMGTTGCEYFDTKLKQDIPIDEDKIEIDFESRKFIRKRPPRIYVMDIIYHYIFSAIAEEGKDEFVTTLDEIIKLLQQYFVSWSGIENEESQIRPSWINQAMKDFCDIGIAERTSKDSNEYRIKWGHQYKKNIGEFMLEKICGKEKEEKKKKAQTTLTDFKSIQ